MLTKHLRLSIDFTITIADTPPETDALNVFDLVYHGRQARLLASVKQHPQILMRWMQDLIASRMESGYSWKDWDSTFQAILAPALATLPSEDRAYFQEVGQTRYFEEFIDLFMLSFTLTEVCAAIELVGPACPDHG